MDYEKNKALDELKEEVKSEDESEEDMGFGLFN